MTSTFYENFDTVSEKCENKGFLLLFFSDFIYFFNVSVILENQAAFHELLPEGSEEYRSEQTEENTVQQRN